MAIKLPLSPLEQEVMSIIWSGGAATAMDIQTALAPQRILRDSTVRTLLTRLTRKGYIRHKVDNRTFIYSSIEPPRSLAVRAVKQIIERFCEGSVESLLVGMVDDEFVDPVELQQIVGRLRSAKRPKAPQRRTTPK
jgi:BlaI family transcriptional regulator, penicillinase repressor